VDLLLVGHAGMRAANRAVFGADETTDVLSLAYGRQPGADGRTAEILVNAELAWEEGTRRAWGPDKELALYMAHGCDHAAGETDATPADRKRMRRRELRWLRECEKEELLNGLFLGPES
jgi:rRNA maturation RNase YbeY